MVAPMIGQNMDLVTKYVLEILVRGFEGDFVIIQNLLVEGELV